MLCGHTSVRVSSTAQPAIPWCLIGAVTASASPAHLLQLPSVRRRRRRAAGL